MSSPFTRRFRPEKRTHYVYCLKSNGAIVYVGATMDLAKRTACHRRERRITFDEVWFFKAKNFLHMRNEETRLIRELRPKFNVAIPAAGVLYGPRDKIPAAQPEIESAHCD
jgi:hypothetical protein